MKKINVSEYMLRKAIMKTDAFKELITEYKARMDAFNNGYYSTVRLNYSFDFEITFAYHHVDWEDEKNEEIYKRCFQFDDTIITNYDFRDKPSVVFAKLITRHILDTIILKDIESYHVIDSIKVDCPWHCIELHHAWTNDKVGIYYIEQECGEHWIVLPKEPEVRMRNYIELRN